MERGLTTLTTDGEAYELDDSTTLYAFPGIAYKRCSIDETKVRCVAIDPADVAELTTHRKGRSVEQTFLSTESNAFIFADEGDKEIYGAYHYLRENQIWTFDEQLLVPTQTSGGGAEMRGNAESYVRLTHEQCDPLCLPIEQFQDGVETGEIRPLWTVSS